jgi:hypothetical protein
MTAIAIVAAAIPMITPTRSVIAITIRGVVAVAISGIASIIVTVMMAVVIDTPQYQS